MVQIFRKNWFVFTLLLFPYTILTRVWIFFDMAKWPIDTEGSSVTFRYLENFLPAEYFWNVILACFLIFINAVQINHIVIKNRLAREINLFPGMIFILMTALHKDMFWVSPQLVAITFLLISLSNIFRIYQKPFASRFIFNGGFFLGLSTLFYSPYIFFLAFLLISILILRKFKFRDFIQVIMGFVLVYFFAAFLRFWNNADYNPFLNFKGQFIIRFPHSALSLHEWIIVTMLLTMVIIVMVKSRKFTIKKSIQSQKKVNLIFWHMTISIFCLIFGLHYLLFPSFLAVLISISILFSMLMARVKNEAALEMAHLFLLFFIIFSHFWF